MQQLSTLHDAVGVYFSAKTQMFARVPSFSLRNVGPLKCFHNHPGWPEVDGFYAVDGEVDPKEVVSAIRDYQPDASHMVTVFTASPKSILRPYAELGYQPLPKPQPFMNRSLFAVPAVELIEDVVPLTRVETTADLDFINSHEMVMEPAHLNDQLFRYYYIQ